MTMFAPHRETLESFGACMHRGADRETLDRLLAEDVVLYGPLGDEPLSGRAHILGTRPWELRTNGE